jgi:single-stranded-DNA-specific exonuclease
MSEDYLFENAPLWIFPEENAEKKEKIVKEFKIHPITAQLLLSRGFSTFDQIHGYLYAKLPDLLDPFLFEEMPKAVDRICEAIEKKETVLISGDNDVDGITGTALLTEFLRILGVETLFCVVGRSTTRKEPIFKAFEMAKENNASLIITVDSGITAVEEIKTIEGAGINVIVTDHHEPLDTLPPSTATLNPKVGKGYPNRDLTGVGVAFKLAHAVTNRLVSNDQISAKKIDLKRFLDLVALGTVADMGPLQGENRILVRYGIKQIRKRRRIGLAKLLEVSEVEPNDEITTFTIASKLAPRINSLGRITNLAHNGVELLLLRNSAQAEKMANELDLNNIERQKIERTISADIANIIAENPQIPQSKAIVLASENWHPGVIAILSTRISKQFNRPTIIISIDGEVGKGSLRSISEFPLLPALKKCANLLLNFGGHDFAAGLVIKKENIEAFTKKFLKIADETLQEKDIQTKILIDAYVPFKELSFDLLDSTSLFEPFGNENSQPIYYTDAKQAWPPKVIGPHLKLYLIQGEGEEERMLEGIAFGKANLSPKLRKKHRVLRVAYTPQANQGHSIQLIIRDIKILE